MYKGLSRWGYAGLALLAVHIVLLFFPPIPPDVKGSLWSYLAGYGAIALLLAEAGRQRSAIATGWAAVTSARRWALGLGVTLAVLALAVALRSLAPSLFARFEREEGLFDPLTLFCYLGPAVMLFGMARERTGAARKHWRFIAGLYMLLALEEIDYFGIFGGLIGRVQGIYAGSLHDLIMLTARGGLSTPAWALIGALFLLIVVALLLLGYLQPGALIALARSLDFLWVSMALGFLLAGLASEAGLFGLVVQSPTLEEALELAGAICFFFYALHLLSTEVSTVPKLS
jgi:hypothetical protein